MRLACRTLFVFLVLATATPLRADPAMIVSVGNLLRQEKDLSNLPQLRAWSTHLASSYDRTGGNNDEGNFDVRDGQAATLLDVDGPGAVVRLWSANPHGEIKIYLDGAAQPVIDRPFSALFDGSTPPFIAPLAGFSSGGYYSYLPIPYAHHCRITVDDPGGLYDQVGYVTYPVDTLVQSFALPLSSEDQAVVAHTLAAWSKPVWPVAGAAKIHTIKAGTTETLARDRGPNVVDLVRATVTNIDDLSLRQLILRAYFDGHKTPDIVAPLSDFFGNAYGHGRDFTSLLLQHQGDVFEAHFPMPFGRSARFTLENGSGHPVTLSWAQHLAHQPFQPGRDEYFHAQWRQETTRLGVPHVWTSVRGRHGHLIGVVLTMTGPHGLGFLEGDEQIRVDSEKWRPSSVPSTVIGPWNGTGTEDFFNSGWYFSAGANALPMNGALVRDDVARVDAYRWLLNDAPVFQSSLDAQIEHGGANDTPGSYYSSVCYWYDDGPVIPWKGMPPASQIALPLPPAPRFVIKDAIEGEALVSSAKMTGGQVQVQGLSGYTGDWSNDQQLWWTGARIGDTLTLPVTAPAAGTYDVIGRFTEAADYGRFTFSIAGQSLKQGLDAYHDGVIPTGPIVLGRVHLPAGPSAFVVTAAGKDPKSANTLFGLDALVLRPVRE